MYYWINKHIRAKIILVAFVLVGSTILTQQVVWAAWKIPYQYRKQVTIDNTKVSGTSDLSSFPVLVSETDTDLRTTGNGGQVAEVKRWGKRRLAYPIQKLKEGYYVLNRIQLEPQMLKEVERSLTLSEEIIRYLIVRG